MEPTTESVPATVSTRRKLSQRLLLLGASTLVCFLLLEVAVRITYGNNLPTYYPQVRHLATAYGHKAEPNQRGTWTVNQPVRTNSHGFRDTEWLVPKPAHTVRIMVVGDSFTFGTAAKAEDRFTDLLRTELQNTGRPVEVINTSAINWDLDNQLAFIRTEGLTYEPDVLVLAFYPNDWIRPQAAQRPLVTQLATDRWLENRPAWLRFVPYRALFLMKRPAFITFARNRVGALMNPDSFVNRVVRNEIDLEHDQTVAFTLGELSKLKRFCDANQIRLVLAAIPPISLFWVPRGSPRYLPHLAEFSRSERIPFVDLSVRFWEAEETDRLYLYPWDGHLSPDGHRLVADQLAPVLRGLVEDR